MKHRYWLAVGVLATLTVSGCLERPDLAASGWACTSDDECAVGATCLSGTCFAPDSTPCFVAADPACDDGLGCTADVCDLGRNVCVHTRIAGTCMTDDATCGCAALDDPGRCVVGVCDPGVGCVERPRSAGAWCGGEGTCSGAVLDGAVCDGSIDGCGEAGTLTCSTETSGSVATCLEGAGCVTLPQVDTAGLRGDWARLFWAYNDGKTSNLGHTLQAVAVDDQGLGQEKTYREDGTTFLQYLNMATTPEAQLAFDWDIGGTRWAELDGTGAFAVTSDLPGKQLMLWFRKASAGVVPRVFEGAWRGFVTVSPPGSGTQTESYALLLDVGSSGTVARATLTTPDDPTDVRVAFEPGGVVNVGTDGLWSLQLLDPVTDSTTTLTGWLTADGKMVAGFVSRLQARVGTVVLLDVTAPGDSSPLQGRYSFHGHGPAGRDPVPEGASPFAPALPFWADLVFDGQGVGTGVAFRQPAPACETTSAGVQLGSDRSVTLSWTRGGWSERYVGWALPGNPSAPRVPLAVVAPVGRTPEVDGTVFEAGFGFLVWRPLQPLGECAD